MQKLYIVAVFALFFSPQCTTAKKGASDVYINNQQLAGRSFHKLFVEVETIDIQLRTKVETDLVDALLAKGCDGVKSHELIPFSLKELKLPSEEEIKLKAKDSGCDAVLLISLSRHGEALTYNQGTHQKKNDQVGVGFLSSALNKRGDDIKPIPSVSTPGSFSHTPAGFFFKSQLFDLPETGLLFAVQSERIDMAAPEKTSKAFAAGLVERLRIERLLKQNLARK
jgi:hypothetical protein